MNVYKVKVNIDDGIDKYSRIIPVFANYKEEAERAVEAFYNNQYDTVAYVIESYKMIDSAGTIIWTDNFTAIDRSEDLL